MKGKREQGKESEVNNVNCDNLHDIKDGNSVIYSSSNSSNDIMANRESSQVSLGHTRV